MSHPGRVVVHERPESTVAADLADALGIAIDVLRATSTLAVARRNGAAAIVPFAETAAALAWRDRTPGALACGEREGRIVAGFDLGNSPFEYAPARVAGRPLAFASTNGSRALLALGSAPDRRLAAFVNAGAVLRHVQAAGRAHVHVVCAGKNMQPAAEDSACAAWLAAALAEAGWAVSLAAGGDVDRWLAAAPRTAAAVRACVESCEHALELAALGPDYARDVTFCATLDVVDLAPAW